MGMGIPWEWELVTKLGMGMGRNGKQHVWEWPLFPRESIPIGGYSVKLFPGNLYPSLYDLMYQ